MFSNFVRFSVSWFSGNTGEVEVESPAAVTLMGRRVMWVFRCCDFQVHLPSSLLLSHYLNLGFGKNPDLGFCIQSSLPVRSVPNSVFSNFILWFEEFGFLLQAILEIDFLNPVSATGKAMISIPFRGFSTLLNGAAKTPNYMRSWNPIPVPHRTIPEPRGQDLDFVNVAHSHLINSDWAKLNSMSTGLTPYRMKHIMLKIKKDHVLSFE